MKARSDGDPFSDRNGEIAAARRGRPREAATRMEQTGQNVRPVEQRAVGDNIGGHERFPAGRV